MTESPTPLFETSPSPKRYFLTNGEDLTASLERGYLDLCAPMGLLVEGAPSADLLSRVTNGRSAGYPVLLELVTSAKRVTPISDVVNVFLRDQKSLTHQQQAIPSLNPFSELLSSVREDLFDGNATDSVPPPVGDDNLLGRLERRASAITAVVVSRKSAEVGRPFIEAVLCDAATSNSLVAAVSSHRHGRTQSPGPVALFIENASARMLEEREEALGPSKMAQIVREIFDASGLTDGATKQVLNDINGFVSSIGGDLDTSKVFTSLRGRLVDDPLSDIHAIANLLVMRPRLNDLLMWPVEEHGAREDQYMAAAYLLGLTQERRLQPSSMRPRSLDVVLVRSISDALATSEETIPNTANLVTLNVAPAEALRINGEKVLRVGPTWDAPTSPSKARATEQVKSGAKPENAAEEIDITTVIRELSEWMKVGSDILRRLENLAQPSTRRGSSRPTRQAANPDLERAQSPKEPSSRKAKLGSAARRPDTESER